MVGKRNPEVMTKIWQTANPDKSILSPDIKHDKLLDTDKGRIPPLSIGKTLYFRTGFCAFFCC